MSTAIIKDTPVDSGRLRNNWFPAINKFSAKTTKYTGKEGNARINDAIRVGNSFDLGDTITITNNLPYVKDIEFGLYPKQPKYGTYVKSQKGKFTKYEIRSVNGFSAKAPQGMVRINIVKWQKNVDEEVRKLK